MSDFGGGEDTEDVAQSDQRHPLHRERNEAPRPVQPRPLRRLAAGPRQPVELQHHPDARPMPQRQRRGNR